MTTDRIADVLEKLVVEQKLGNELAQKALELAEQMSLHTAVSLNIQRAHLQLAIEANPPLAQHIVPLVGKIDEAMGIQYEPLPEETKLDSGEEKSTRDYTVSRADGEEGGTYRFPDAEAMVNYFGGTSLHLSEDARQGNFMLSIDGTPRLMIFTWTDN